MTSIPASPLRPLNTRAAGADDPRQQRFRTALQHGLPNAIISHAAMIGLFAWQGVTPLAVFNVFSVILFTAAYIRLRAGRPMLALVSLCTEVAVHAVLAVELLGLDSGFHYYLLTLYIAAALAPLKRSHTYVLVVATTVLFVGLETRGRNVVPSFIMDPQVTEVTRMINIAFSLLILSLTMFLFRALADESEESLQQEHARSEALLHNILPVTVAARLKEAPTTIAEGFGSASVLFADVVGFTPLSARLPAEDLVSLLNDLFSRFDDLVAAHGVEKIKTIGDAYMVASGIPQQRPDHAEVMVRLGLELIATLKAFSRERGMDLDIRVGIHSGPVVAGVIGKTKFLYDLWGDAVNTAARMESHGVPGRIHVSDATHALVQDRFQLESRGVVDIKGKGPMRTWLVLAPAPIEA